MLDADRGEILYFAQAQAKAQARAVAWFQEIERGAGLVVEPVTVSEAMEHYVADYLARGGKGERDLRRKINALIAPELGERRVADLTLAHMRAWQHRLAAAPARLRSKAQGGKANIRKAEDADNRRARPATANRVLTVLKAALSLAYREGRVPSEDAWRRVKPFAGNARCLANRDLRRGPPAARPGAAGI